MLTVRVQPNQNNFFTNLAVTCCYIAKKHSVIASSNFHTLPASNIICHQRKMCVRVSSKNNYNFQAKNRTTTSIKCRIIWRGMARSKSRCRTTGRLPRSRANRLLSWCAHPDCLSRHRPPANKSHTVQVELMIIYYSCSITLSPNYNYNNKVMGSSTNYWLKKNLFFQVPPFTVRFVSAARASPACSWTLSRPARRLRPPTPRPSIRSSTRLPLSAIEPRSGLLWVWQDCSRV